MRWFAAHIVMVVELEQKEQDHFPAWENVVLVKAASEAEAYRKAEELGRDEEGDDDGTFRWGKQPARWIFAGVRKLTECAQSGDRPEDGDEITYLEFEFKTKRDIKRFVSGKPAAALIKERYRTIEVSESESGKQTGASKRKRA
jgi:Domain of unknown function (DUF4288)